MTPMKTKPMTPEMRQGTKDCMDAAMICVEMEAVCLETAGVRIDAPLLMMIKDCAEMCRLSAESALRGSECRTIIANAAAEICARCAEDCARFVGDKEMHRCADACAKAVVACRKMAKA
jgi:hypothetical protein